MCYAPPEPYGVRPLSETRHSKAVCDEVYRVQAMVTAAW
jgi:hypothetical protein